MSAECNLCGQTGHGEVDCERVRRCWECGAAAVVDGRCKACGETDGRVGFRPGWDREAW